MFELFSIAAVFGFVSAHFWLSLFLFGFFGLAIWSNEKDAFGFFGGMLALFLVVKSVVDWFMAPDEWFWTDLTIINLLHWIITNPFTLLWYGSLYAIGALVYSFVRWNIYTRKNAPSLAEMREMLESYKLNIGENRTAYYGVTRETTLDEFYLSEHFPMNFNKHYSRVAGWAVLWPAGLFWDCTGRFFTNAAVLFKMAFGGLFTNAAIKASKAKG